MKVRNENMKNIFRQGDILFVEIEKLPELHQKEVKEFVIAEGEISGHKHKLVIERPKTKVKISSGSDGYYLDISGDEASVVHEDHKTITLQPGKYHVYRQQEYDAVKYKKSVQD